MLSELNQLLVCRRERENRAAAALRQARTRQAQLQASVEAARVDFEKHEQDRKLRQDKLYRRTLRAQLSSYQIDSLNIELDLMAEETDALTRRIQEAQAAAVEAAEQVAAAAAAYHKQRQASDRWNHLVDDVAERERQQAERAEEFAIEDDLGDRRVAGSDGI